jgi:pilus assembly protein CpaB
MSSTALKVLALLALVLAAGLGLVAYRMSQTMVTPTVADPTENSGAQTQTMAVVAIKPLTAYVAVPAESVALVPVAVLPPEYFSKPEQVVGRAPLIDIEVGTTLGQRFFRDANTLVRSIPPGFQAMSLEINDVIAVGGFVRPGDLVDVLLYIRSTGREVEDSQARILLREARVLAYEDRVLNDAEPSDTGQADSNNRQTQQQRARRVRTAVLAVPETDTTRVMLGASLGELRLSLRGARPEDETQLGQAETTPGTLATATGSARVDASASPKTAVDPTQKDQVITLRELAGIKKKQGTTTNTPAAPAVIIYRGNEVQRVNR